MVRLMNRSLTALLCLAACAAPASAAERSYSVTDFERVSVEGPYVVRLVTGRPSAARATGPREAIERVTIATQGQTLYIRPNRSAWTGTPGAQQGVVEVTLTTRTLRAGRVIGAGTLEIEGMRGLRADLSVEGSGRLRATGIAADNLSAGIRGSGSLELAGRARSVRVDVQGSGDIDAPGLAADDLVLNSATTGTVALGPARTARINAGGIGAVSVLGRPACTVTGPGAGQVRCGSDQRQFR